MPLHPDKLVGVTRAIQNRPRRPRPSIAVAAQRVASGRDRKYLTGKPPVQGEPGLLENLAYQLRQEHEERHVNRIARRVDRSLQGQERRPQAQAEVSQGRPAQGPIEPSHVQIHVEAPQPLKPLGASKRRL